VCLLQFIDLDVSRNVGMVCV